MDILKSIRHTEAGEKYLRNGVEYAFKEKTEEGEKLIETRGYGVSDNNPEDAWKQMYAVKEYFGKTGDNPIMHFMVSFDNSVSTAETAISHTVKIAGILKDDYQVVTAVHQEDQGNSKFHSHFITNSVNYNNGKLYHSGVGELIQLAVKISKITGNYCDPNFG